MDGLALGFGPIGLEVNKEGRQMSYHPTLVRITEKRMQAKWYIYHVNLIGEKHFVVIMSLLLYRSRQDQQSNKFKWLKFSDHTPRRGKQSPSSHLKISKMVVFSSYSKQSHSQHIFFVVGVGSNSSMPLLSKA